MAVVIRRVCAADYPAVCRLLSSLDELHQNRLPWMFQGADLRTPEFIADLASRDDSALFVADVEGVVGVAHGLLRRAPDLPIFVAQHWGVLDSLAVDPAWRRRGIGRLLAQSVEAWAFERGAAWVEVSVYDFNDSARKFYESLKYLPLRTIVRKPCNE
jgi:GNAT superfamily N-acetyltransferase